MHFRLCTKPVKEKVINIIAGKRNKLLLTTRKWHTETMDTNPIGVYDIASYARNFGFTVDVYYMDELPVTGDYGLVGLSVFEGKNETVFNDILFLKGFYPATKIIVGGRWTKLMDDEASEWFRKNEIDVWANEGEKFFNGDNEINFSEYPGWYKKDILTTHAAGRNIMSSRGCPFHCYFCHNPENKINYFSPRYTVDNIQLLLEQKVPVIFFADDIFTLKEEHMLGIYEEMKSRSINISGQNLFFTHVNLIKQNTLPVMKLFNPVEVQVGLESGDNRMLKLMGKSFTVEKAFSIIKELANFVPVNGLFLIGYPGETIESLSNTLEFVKMLKPYLTKKWVSIYQPIKNTIGYYESLKNGIFHGELINNSIIHYVPDGLQAEDLIKYRDLIMQN